MRIPTQPGSSNGAPAPAPVGRPNHGSPAAPVKPPGMTMSTFATLSAILGVGGIGFARHFGGNLDIISVGWTTALAIGAIGFAGIVAQGLYRALGQRNAVANAAFISAMTLFSICVMLIKGPVHEFTVAKLSTVWPAASKLLARTDPDSRAARTAHSASPIKEDAVIHVYRKGGQSVSVQPKGD